MGLRMQLVVRGIAWHAWHSPQYYIKINKPTNKQAGMYSLGGGAGESGVQDHSWLHNEFQRQPEIPSQK